MCERIQDSAVNKETFQSLFGGLLRVIKRFTGERRVVSEREFG